MSNKKPTPKKKKLNIFQLVHQTRTAQNDAYITHFGKKK